MFRCCLKRSLYCMLWPFSTATPDVLTGKTPTEQKLQVEKGNEEVPEETGWDRVKKIFEKNDFGGLSPELSSIVQVTYLSVLVGSIYGAVNDSRKAYLSFIKNNQATSFEHHYDAKKKLQDAVTKGFAKGAFKWSWRVTLFSTSFVGTYTIIQKYRDKCGILEYFIAGITSGFLYKFKLGPRGWIVGAGVGGVLGLVGGGATNLLLSLSGMNMDEARKWQSHWSQERSRYDARKTEEHRQKEQNALLYSYSQAHADEKVSLDKVENKS